VITEYDLCQKQCDELEKILRSLYPWQRFDQFADQRLAGTETSDLGIQLHHLDIETGDISPPDTPYFLPRKDFPEISDACKSSPPKDCVLWRVNKDFENQRTDSSIEYDLPSDISLALRMYSFDPVDDSRRFTCPKYVSSLQNSWRCEDHLFSTLYIGTPLADTVGMMTCELNILHTFI
jgi:hypothetical protein